MCDGALTSAVCKIKRAVGQRSINVMALSTGSTMSCKLVLILNRDRLTDCHDQSVSFYSEFLFMIVRILNL